MKILVTEDQPTQLKLAHDVLIAAGHDVSLAGNAGEVFAAIRQDRPQLIFLDLGLPGVDGLDLVHQLKTDPKTRDIHIVAITSYTERYPKAAALAAGCDAYLVKPIDTRELSNQLNAVAKEGGTTG